MDRFDPEVLEDLSSIVEGNQQDHIRWFEELRKEWRKGPPTSHMDVARLVYKASTAAIEERFILIDRALTDPLATLADEMDRFETDPKVLKDLNRLVNGDEEEQIKWFKALREEWKKGPPETPMDAGLLVYKIMTEMYYDFVLDSDFDGFLFHYSLPCYIYVKEEHIRRTTSRSHEL